MLGDKRYILGVINHSFFFAVALKCCALTPATSQLFFANVPQVLFIFPWAYGHILTHCLHMQRRGQDNKNLFRLQPLLTSSDIHSMANIKC
jgi:hypothetical protein